MSQFLSSILSRHVNTVEKVQPRLPGNFEPANSYTETGLSALPEQFENKVFSKQIVSDPGVFSPSDTHREIPDLSDKPIHLLRQNNNPNSSQNNIIFQQPITQHTDQQQFGLSPRIEESINSQYYQDNKAYNTSQTDEPLDWAEIPERQDERIISTETHNARALPKIEPDGSRPLMDVEAREPINHPPIYPSESGKKNVEIKGALGDPPGQLHSFGLSSSQAAAGLNAEAKPAPVIKVSIGQINVRAVTPAPSVSTPKPRPSHKPILTLEDYLKGRG